MRQVIDQVICDDCGMIYQYELLRATTNQKLARIESLTKWLREHGWDIDYNGGRDTCPLCADNQKGK